MKMKNNKKQSNNANITNKANNCNKKNANITNKLDSNKKSNNVNGFTNESKSFQLDDNDEHSFEVR